MTLDVQKYLRLILPGIFLYGLLVILCWTTNWCDLVLPQSWEELTKLLAAIVLGFLYSLTPLREISNNCFHLDVNQNISAALVRPFESEIPHSSHIGWNNLKHVFYYFVDKDESLKTKSSIIRFNGLLWTSAADLRVVSILGVLIFSASMICSHYSNLVLPQPISSSLQFNEYRAGGPIFFLTLLFLATFYFSKTLTIKHKKLGDEQCEYILLHYKDELKEKISKLSSSLR